MRSPSTDEHGPGNHPPLLLTDGAIRHQGHHRAVPSVRGIVSRRIQALLAAGLLAFSTITPVGAWAAEPDQEHIGTASPPSPGQTGNTGHAQNPDFDPGGTTTALPTDTTPPHPGNDDTAPLESEPTTDRTEPIVDPGDAPATPGSQNNATASTGQTPQPAAPAVPPPPPEPPQTPSPTPTPPAASSPAATLGAPPTAPPQRPRTATTKNTHTNARHHQHTRRPDAARHQPVSTSAAPAPTTPVDVRQRSSTASSSMGSFRTGDHAEPGDRTHIVLPGESLWSIASDILDGHASAPAIAREVHRLWTLNKERIRTGNPDLLPVGTKLRLR